MRSIKFRGKRVDNGELVYGGIITKDEYTAIVVYSDYHGWHDFVEVENETVGQFTGLRAEHGQGKEVYRGDIVRITMACENVVIGEVTWDEDIFGWAVDIGPEFWDFGNIVMCHHLVEVIGNIHDNPDLLK